MYAKVWAPLLELCFVAFLSETIKNPSSPENTLHILTYSYCLFAEFKIFEKIKQNVALKCAEN